MALGEPTGRANEDEARAADLGGGMRNEGVFAQAMGRRGRMAEAFLRHERRPETPPRVDAESAAGAAPR